VHKHQSLARDVFFPFVSLRERHAYLWYTIVDWHAGASIFSSIFTRLAAKRSSLSAICLAICRRETRESPELIRIAWRNDEGQRARAFFEIAVSRISLSRVSDRKQCGRRDAINVSSSPETSSAEGSLIFKSTPSPIARSSPRVVPKRASVRP